MSLFLGKSLTPAALSSLFFLANPSSAEDFSLSLNSELTAEVSAPRYVDMHTVFLLDVSSSVSPDERAIMLSGIYQALLSDEAKAHFSRGLSRAFTIVYFADSAASTQTYVVNTHDEAMSMAQSVLWNPLLEIPAQNFEGVGVNTNMLAGLALVADTFANEKNDGLISVAKSVVAMADDPSQGNHDEIRTMSDMLTAVYGVSLFCGPVTKQGVDAAVHDFLLESVQTPEDAIFVDDYGFASAVRPGITQIVVDPQDATAVVSAALRLQGS